MKNRKVAEIPEEMKKCVGCPFFYDNTSNEEGKIVHHAFCRKRLWNVGRWGCKRPPGVRRG